MNEQEWLKPATTVGNDQQSRLAAMLRQGMSNPIQGQSNTPDLNSFETMNKINKGFDKLNGQNAASDYIGEFGKFDPQLQATLGNDATWMQKIGGLF